MLFVAAALVHLGLFALISFRLQETKIPETLQAEVMKLVDITEIIPKAPPVPQVAPPLPQTQTVVVAPQAAVAEEVVVTEKQVIEEVTEFLPQHRISEIPVIPSSEILARIEYPAGAARQGIEGVVYLELYIDKEGTIRRIEVLKDPGYGFAQSALRALEGLRCSPARANGEAVAVRFRYPVRFSLK